MSKIKLINSDKLCLYSELRSILLKKLKILEKLMKLANKLNILSFPLFPSHQKIPMMKEKKDIRLQGKFQPKLMSNF